MYLTYTKDVGPDLVATTLARGRLRLAKARRSLVGGRELECMVEPSLALPREEHQQCGFACATRIFGAG